MTMPSALVAAIVTKLREKFPDLDVQEHSGKFGSDGKDFTTVKTPGLLVTCVGAPQITNDDDPPIAAISVVVFVVVKLTKDERSLAGLAADTAASIATLALVERWGVAYRCASRASFRNEFTEKLADKGYCIWSVTWQQQLQLDFDANYQALLQKLSRIRFNFVAGIKDVEGNDTDNDTDDLAAQVELTGATPPQGNP